MSNIPDDIRQIIEEATHRLKIVAPGGTAEVTLPVLYEWDR